MDRPCVVLVGAGGYGAGYMMELLAKDAGADLVGICDISPDLKERYPIIAEKGIPVYQNLEAFYARHAADLAVIVRRRRKGKIVTVIVGFVLTENDLHELSKTLKTLCGAGGTVKINDDNSQTIEIQGDHRAKIAAKLQSLGYKVKGSF